MSRFRAGLVGCGLFGESHAAALTGIPDVELAAVFDIDQEKANDFARRFRVAKVAPTFDDLLSESLDAIHVVTPEARHRDAVVAALASGRHVLVEKPFATTVADCEAMIKAARESRRHLMVGHILRFDLRYATIRERVLCGDLGRVVYATARRNRARSGLLYYQRVHPGIVNAIHDIDLILGIIDSKVTRVRAFERRVHGAQTPDFFLGTLEFENGAIGQVQTSWLLPDAAGIALDDFVQVIGDKGVGNLALQPPTVAIWGEQGYSAPDCGYETRLFGGAQGAILNEISYFYRCLREDREPKIVTTVDATNAVRTALALVESARIGNDVEVVGWMQRECA